MNTGDLENKLHNLGFPLVEARQQEDVNRILAELVHSQDMRYWEGFPVVLANAAKEQGFSYARAEQFLTHPDERKQLKELFLMSLALYEVLNLKFSWVGEWRKHAPKNDVVALAEFQKKLAANQPLEVFGRQFFAQRLKDIFANYYQQEGVRAKALEKKQDAFSLEYALSQVFSRKQKELFKKKLSGEPLTKTEREYFSRVVKKKVLALANPELHRLSQRLLE